MLTRSDLLFSPSSPGRFRGFTRSPVYSDALFSYNLTRTKNYHMPSRLYFQLMMFDVHTHFTSLLQCFFFNAGLSTVDWTVFLLQSDR